MPHFLVRKSFVLPSLTLVCLGLLVSLGWTAGKSPREISITDKRGRPVGLYKESHALVIGISDYTDWPRLPGVIQDIEAVSGALEKNGFQVKVVMDPNKRELEQAYENFIQEYGFAPNNRLLFYFAGHGYTHKPAYAPDDPKEWMGYIVPRDAPVPQEEKPGPFLHKAMSMQRYEELAVRTEAKHAMFLFDSCFSGAIFAITRAMPKEISEQAARPVRQFIFSGTADQEVPDESTFRQQFVSALGGEADGNADGYVTGSELGKFLETSVANYTREAQTPQYGKIRHRHLDKGDFVFALRTALAPSVSTLSTPAPPAPLALQGHLQVNVNVPQARVILNGTAAGESQPGQPLHLRDITAGTVHIRVEATGYVPHEQSVTIHVQQSKRK